MNASVDIRSSARLEPQERDNMNERMSGGSRTSGSKLLDELLDGKKSEEDRDQPCCGGSSPQSVIARFDEGGKEEATPRKPRSRRGIDSPMKRVDTRNVYESALKKNNSEGSNSSDTSSSISSAATKQHRRQMTNDSTHSKVAAVARGASKAAEEACDTEAAIPALLDRPIACPQRQHTGGTVSDVSCTSDVSCNFHSEVMVLPFRRLRLPPNRPAIRRPPRRDTIHGDIRSTIFRMKNSVLAQPVLPTVPTTSSLPGNDQPAPCPVRLPTAEKQPDPDATPRIQPRVVSPRALLSKFDRQTSADTRDDDSDSWSIDQDGAYFQPRPHTPTSDLVKAWLSMPKTPPYSQAQVITPLATPNHTTTNVTDDDRTFGDSSHLLTTPTPAPGQQHEDDESAMVNDRSKDNRMLQAHFKLPPRACTTPNAPLPLHPSSSSFSGIFLQTPNHGRATTCGVMMPVVGTPTFIKRHITTVDQNMACLDISAIEVSIDLSLPSFFADCRAQITDAIMPAIRKHTPLNSFTSTEPQEQENNSKQGTASTTKSSTITTTNGDDPPMDAASVSSQTSLSLAELVAPPKMDAAMPPAIPHRRKPNLIVNNSKDEQEAMLWTSMPIVLPSSPMSPHCTTTTTRSDLRSSWPRIFDVPSISSPPTMPNRFRRQDSLLPSEAHNETMVPPPPSAPQSPPRRSSHPPVLPHRRKPSLDVSSPPGKPSRPQSHRHPQDYVPVQPNLWSSLPSLSDASAEDNVKHTLPPTMPHRRKPSLEIHPHHDTGSGEASIEMWLPEPQATTTGGCCTPPSELRKGRHQRHDSTPSIVLKEGEMEI